VEEFLDLARERGVRPEELVPDVLEDERESVARMGLRRPKKVPALANRFLWCDVLFGGLLSRPVTPEEAARLWVFLKLHELREDHDEMSNASVQAFWLLKHSIFGDQNGYARVVAKAKATKSALLPMADAEARRFWDKKKAPFDRAALARAIEARSSR
jgi:hypothetical protein